MKVECRAPTMRGLWRLLETLHAPVYYAPESTGVYRSIGLHNPTTAYFATRTAPFGMVDPKIVSACLYAFAPALVAQHLSDAWKHTTPQDALTARLEVFDRASRRMLGAMTDEPVVGACGRLLADLVGRSSPNGRPVFAANASTSRPSTGHLQLFWATTALREFRGDAHAIALQSAGVTPVQSHVIMSALGLVPRGQAILTGWTSHDQSQAEETLRDKGWFDRAGHLTREGRRRRSQIEHETDRISEEALIGLGEKGTAEVTHLLSAIASKFITAGAIPYPNRSGVAPVAELGVLR